MGACFPGTTPMTSSAVGPNKPSGAALPIRLFRAIELPAEVPGALFTDGENTVVLVNPTYLGNRDLSAWLREVLNSLLATADDTGPRQLRAIV